MKADSSPDLHAALRRYFGHDAFRPGQEEIIGAVMDGRPCVAVMPTGGGKSLCFQLPAVLRPGVTIVVSPLIALMKDQVDGLTDAGLAATFINSSLGAVDMNRRLVAMARGDYRLVYVAPERFRNERFLAALDGVDVGLFVVDEAHCISAWGHDFRPDYMRLGQACARLGRPRIIALTATATPEVRDDIITQLDLVDPVVIVSGFARPGLKLSVHRVSGREGKLVRTRRVLAECRTGIVYCATRANVERVRDSLSAGDVRCIAYHGGMDEQQRKTAQDSFMSGSADVAVATNAFGMGIDRADLRCVVHWDVPGSIEAYYQEAGRAGRDGGGARCELLFNFADVRTQEFFIEGANPSPELVRKVAGEVADLCGGSGAPFPLPDLFSRLEEANRMAVGTALGLLDRVGFLARGRDPESGDGCLVLLDGAADPGPVISRLDEKLERDRLRLRLMLRYVDSRECRVAAILRYFGDPAGETECGVCDNCLRKTGEDGIDRRQPTEAEWVEIQKVLSCTTRMRGRFGRARIVQVLAGSRDKAVLKAGLDRLPTWGAMADRKQPYIRRLLDALQDAGCLEAAGDEFPTLRVSDYGAQVIHRRVDVRLALSRSAGSKDADSGGSSAESASTQPALPELEADLRRWRTEQAARRSVPAYCILSNKVLEALGRERPRSNDQLLEVKGIGPAKLEEFGDDLLRLISRYE